ncbi:tetratricopeptide repeat protein [Tsuneonella sp. YG55]|uniref:Tetratricopeptide repeat protein n=1 Tax=Tsuneonella litorea TaxID=2976475 RepID=A0A9X3A8P1_9SPHN|nr:tetratricopeptide repeat protein [Tsuneonella litorea]MCT2559666.1 tetratricopeptide repeat protein [Tsuneonella litorea]
MRYGPQQLATIHARMVRGDIAGALADIDAAVTAEPGNAAAWHLAGVVRRKAGDPEAAVRAFDTAIACGLANAEIENSRGLSLQDLGRTDEALAAFERAREHDPAYVPASVNQARLLAELGRLDEASAMLEALVAANPGSSLARNALAATMRDMGEPERAVAVYRETLARDPANSVATVRLGQALRDAGEPGAALEHYRHAAGRMGASPEFAESMAGALVDNGRADEARALLERLTAGSPAYFAGHRALARLTREYGVGDDPWRSYRSIAGQWPGEPSIWLDWLAQLVSFRDYDDVRQVAADARAAVGERAEFALYQAIADGELGNTAEAEARFAALEDAMGETGPYLTARARVALRRGEPAQAESLATRATAIDRADVFGWAYLGLAWRLQDDPREFWLHDYAVQARQVPLPHLEDPDALAELVETLRGLHRAQHHPPDQSLRNGTQTQGALFARKEHSIRLLRDAVLARQEEYARDLPQDEAHPFYARNTGKLRFTGSWSVRLHGEGFHISHLHQAGWISSALHLVVPPACAEDIEHAGKLVLGAPPAELGLDLPPRRVIEPVAGALVLFPSSMWHGTVPFRGGAERLTVAFDSVPA